MDRTSKRKNDDRCTQAKAAIAMKPKARREPSVQDLRDCLAAAAVIDEAIAFIKQKSGLFSADIYLSPGSGMYSAAHVFARRDQIRMALSNDLNRKLGEVVGKCEPGLFDRLLSAKCDAS